MEGEGGMRYDYEFTERGMKSYWRLLDECADEYLV